MTTPAQKWAQERNMTKGRVSSIKALATQIAHLKSTTPQEKDRLLLAATQCNWILGAWEHEQGSSKQRFLKAR